MVLTIRADDARLGRFKRWSARAFYRVLAWCSKLEVRPSASDFRLLSRAAVDGLLHDGIDPAQEVTALYFLVQGLVGPLAPDTRPQKGDPDTATLVEAIIAFCLQAVSARPWSSDPTPRLRAVEE